MSIPLASYYDPQCSSDHWIIQDSARTARPDLGLREGEAARLALQELEKLKGSAAHRLSLVPATHSLPQLQSLIRNLDKYLFRGLLKNNASFRLSSDLPPNIHGSTSALGALGNQIVVSLNSLLMRHPSHLALVASLIHHMTHAYLLVCCGFGTSNANDGRHDLKHGLAFSSIVHTIHDILVDDARIPLPNLFYCSDAFTRSTRLPRHRSDRYSLHSYCHFDDSDHEDKRACGAYMQRVISEAQDTSFDSPEKSSPANACESVSMLGSLVNRAQMENFYRPQIDFYHYLPHPTMSLVRPAGDIPVSGDYQALLNLQAFLAFGDYEPRVLVRFDSSDLDGPPRIHVDDKHLIKASNLSNPLDDLRTYILALRTSVEPLRRLALLRLYSQKLLKKEINAMYFLEEIYTGAPSCEDGPGVAVKDYKPDDDLRHFVLAFLCAAHPDLPTKAPGVIQLEYEDTIYGRRFITETDTEPATRDNTNLHILETTDGYKGRLSKLRGNGGLFLEDLDKVKSALGNQEPVKPPADLLVSDAGDGTLQALEASNANPVGSRTGLERLEAAEKQHRAFDLYQQYRRRRPVLGLGGIPASFTVDSRADEVRLDDFVRMQGLRF
ncbi:hypothetical protein GJ744_011425 [Endocarpon pusillum]|uniref:Uncharacterized protein n=1 Tax=Endocarpon pusillum TaxID=364733 RepID=A0A8H7ADE1_9EURO|nr:hypothetical protein GJ744_011425 [Endocarpon pusillum]